MTATLLDIEIEQGGDYGGSFTVLGPDGQPLDLTGYSAAMQIKLATGFPYAILTLTTLNGGLEIDGPDGVVTPIIAGATTAAINAGKYAYDLKLIAPNFKTTRAFQGAAYVSAEVTDTPAFPPSTFLLEGGGFLLLEDGSPLLVENGNGPQGTVQLLLEDGSALLLEDGMSFLLDDGDAAPSGPALLLENGNYLLAEDGNYLLLEAS